MVVAMLNDIFLDRLPSIDLHGYDMQSARVRTNDFIKEALIMQYERIVIVHGIGEGKVKASVHNTLQKNKNVLAYRVDNFNVGCTIVDIKL